ncbi:MAG: hypothetical protein A2402_01420 [Candidatus Staskawiczbacteria bacterium RIFOXYC1_FULL_37_43]|nr:MAG: hypothetical protein A2813_00190 [Candidatus Staskawiczbacteria bacterium RIFCSPHIGHO2_01_FULL_37_17]OGZ71983.1 MAG: hypothetical protein A2891_03505 [Candidatus Staskawiczbacteria bacterium RIFCSPLOWO2_01_FULL_37_19]OGZ75522.1 MAG: hypothetical protein A2205_01975 [Candidatus Staskawiczbacteria bacterium RIFOXYA1_FULL_37_15]OGZ77886.1 MAG: hypothetical protein A2280_03870 [Candidatus Staskawiczbacteria bacterium RIFOXYA12_FULL_37_10]OGZ80510.1 MAG: hypothetical protein A2353_03240 [Can
MKIEPNLAKNWHTRYTIKALTYGDYDTAIAVFCPSYKKDGEIGFRRKIGESTKEWLTFMRGLSVENKILLYWDLCLENWEKLTDNDMEYLDDCWQDFKKNSGDFLTVFRLSDFEEFVEKITQEGKIAKIPEKYEKSLMDRSRIFYKPMGWDDKKIRERLERLSNAYLVIGEWIKNQKTAFLVMTEHAYERGCLYGQVPIIYPDKKQLFER